MNQAQSTKIECLKLLKSKSLIENDIQALEASLEPIGRFSPLVNEEGYPLDNVDIIHVRHTRRKLNMLINDYKDLMKRLQHKMEAIHAEECSGQLEIMYKPIAIVNSVALDSPAYTAGLLKHDKILQLDYLNEYTLEDFNELSLVVKYKEGKLIRLSIQREETMMDLKLEPKKWSGAGLIGYHHF